MKSVLCRRSVTRLGLAALLAASGAQAEDFFGEVQTEASAPAPLESQALQWLGWLQQKVGYGYRSPVAGFDRDQADLTRLETQVYGQVTYTQGDWRARLAGSLSHDWLPDLAQADIGSGYRFSDAHAEARRWRWQWADSTLSWQPGDLWLQAGYQTLAWGEAESLIVTDVLARRDQRWPGQADLEQLRLPVPAATFNWAGNLSLVVLGPTDTDRYPAPYQEFDPLAAWRVQDVDIDLSDPEQELGFAARWQQQWPGLDAEVMIADVNAYQPALKAVTLGLVNGQPGVERIELQPARTQVAGLGLRQARGSWLFTTEQAWHNGVKIAADDPMAPWPDHSQWRGMVAAEYSGLRNLTISGEIGHIHTLDGQSELAVEEWQFSQSVRARWTTWRDRLTITAQGIGLPGNEGLVTRLAADWKTNDRLSLGATLVDYHAESDNQQLHPFRNNDAVIVTARLGF